MESQANIVDYFKLEKICDRIHEMDKIHHEYIFTNIIKKNREDTSNVEFSENKSGIWIVMNKLNNEVIEDLQKYIDLVDSQDKMLSQREVLKEKLHKSYFTKLNDNGIETETKKETTKVKKLISGKKKNIIKSKKDNNQEYC